MKRRRRRPLVELHPAELDGAQPGQPALFLGRFDADALWRELARAGLNEELAQRGYPDVVLRTELVSGEHRLRLLPRGGRVSLVDLRLSDYSQVPDEALLRRRGLDILSCLSVHWLSLQSPRAHFTRERPRLPGQRYPGLGLGRVLFSLVLRWASAWGKDGLLNHPQYFHNAVFYGVRRPSASPPTRSAGSESPLPPFRFLSPTHQGRFEALLRDLAHLHVAAASAAVDGERVREEGSGRVARWEPGEMAVPLTAGLRGYLESEEYRHAADTARDAVRFSLSA